MEQTAENPYCPKDWNEHDLKAASVQFNAFLESDAYKWLANYLGCRQRQCEKGMAPKKPSALEHAEYVELASRTNEIICLWGAIGTLAGLMNELGKEKPNEKG